MLIGLLKNIFKKIGFQKKILFLKFYRIFSQMMFPKIISKMFKGGRNFQDFAVIRATLLMFVFALVPNKFLRVTICL